MLKSWKASMLKVGVLLCLGAYIALELSSPLGLFLLKTQIGAVYAPADQLSPRHRNAIQEWTEQSSPYLRHDANLGWTILENGRTDLYQANDAGIRYAEAVSRTKPKSTRRIACFGDSFTHGDTVANKDTWQAYMEADSVNLEILNFGVSGYAIDQSFLRYQTLGSAYQADIVLIGFMSKDVFENVNRFRPFQLKDTGMPFAKPRYKIESEENLSLLKNPLPNLSDYESLLADPETHLAAIGQNDFYYQRAYKSGPFDFLPSVRLFKILSGEVDRRLLNYGVLTGEGLYREDSPAYRTSIEVISEFAATVEEDGSKAYIVFLPNADDIRMFRSSGRTSYLPMREELEAKGIRCIDTVAGFDEQPVEELIAGHYTAEGNRKVAASILAQLKLPQISRE